MSDRNNSKTAETTTESPLPEGWDFLGHGWAAAPEGDDANFDAALRAARGEYQKDIIRGFESWSGSTLKGKRRKYASRYAQGRKAMEARMRAGGVSFFFETIDRRKVLCIGAKPDA